MSYMHQIFPASPTMRIWPYPFEAGLAISNDAEFMSFEFFEELMAFMNGKSDTAFGKGLGLSVTSSVFFYSAHPYNFSYFDGYKQDSLPSACSENIIKYIREGWIDTIHAYGDFDGVGGFNRSHAEKVFDVLNNHNISLDVFTNHGGVENWQNVGCDAAYHRGDVCGHEAYHSDLMAQNGIRFVWTDSMVTLKPDRQRVMKNIVKRAINILKGCSISPEKRLLVPTSLQDGQVFEGFMRFRSTGVNAPNLSSLHSQMNQIDWNKLYKSNSCMVVYQHLGVIDRINGKCSSATIDTVRKNSDRLLSGFYKIKEQVDAGKLWFAGAAELLRYVSMLQTTRIEQSNDAEIALKNDLCKTNPQKFFQGLTLYLADSGNPSVIWNGHVLEYYKNGPDKTGRNSITLPLSPKKDIWS